MLRENWQSSVVKEQQDWTRQRSLIWYITTQYRRIVDACSRASAGAASTLRLIASPFNIAIYTCYILNSFLIRRLHHINIFKSKSGLWEILRQFWKFLIGFNFGTYILIITHAGILRWKSYCLWIKLCEFKAVYNPHHFIHEIFNASLGILGYRTKLVDRRNPCGQTSLYMLL